MHFTCPKTELMTAMNIAKRAIARAQETILDCILFEARDDTVTLKATNKSTYIRTKLNGPAVHAEGLAAVPSSLLIDMVAHMPDAQITLKLSGNSVLEVSCLAVHTQLRVMNPEEFPVFPEMGAHAPVKIAPDLLSDMIRQTSFAAATVADRPILTGVLFDFTDDRFTMVAIDGFRMAIREEKVHVPENGQFVAPSIVLREISQLADTESGEVSICFDSARALFQMGQTQVYTQLLEGKYIAYENLFPKSFSTYMQIDRREFQSSVERALIIMRQEGSNVITLDLKENLLTISARSQSGQIADQVSTVTRGDDIRIALNGRFILNVLKVIDDDEIMATFNTSITPVAIERSTPEGSAYRYLILPVQTQH